MNKTSTRVEVRWNVAASGSLSAAQRELLLRKLASRIDSNGVLRVTADERRSQTRNRAAAVERLNTLVQEALKQPRPRRRTKPPAAAIENRLEGKRHRSQMKRRRRDVDEDE